MLMADPNRTEMEDSPLSNSEGSQINLPSVIPVTTSNNPKFISSKALLLRLFQSELFTSLQALHYLQKYSNEPGIQYYLCERLKEFSESELEGLIPQLW